MAPRYDSRDSGVEFAVGCLLFALGVGFFVPRPGDGLFCSLIQSGGFEWIWRVSLCASSLFLIAISFYRAPAARLAAVVSAMVCWFALAFRFVEASLWGATLQAVIALLLLNGCAFRLFRYLQRG